MQYFNFKRLIEKYSREYKVLIPSKSDYNVFGDWVEGEPTEETLTGAIFSLRENTIYRSEGNLTAEDRILYTLYPLKFALTGTKVVFEDKEYTVLENSNNSEFTGVWQYTLKHISAFNEGGGIGD